MPRSIATLPVFALATLLPVQSAQAQIEFQGAGQRNELECNGETVHVQGADNRLTIHGACRSLIVEGAGNEIRIALAAQSSIRVQGASNQVAWTAPGTAKPKLSIAGAANRVYRSK